MQIAAYVLQGMLALMFLIAGAGKVAGSKMHVENFNRWKLPQWFRIVTGIVELAGAALLVIGYTVEACALAGGLLLGFTGIGGALVHLRVKDPFNQTVTILVLGILSFVVFFLYL
jgi:DoxX.